MCDDHIAVLHGLTNLDDAIFIQLTYLVLSSFFREVSLKLGTREVTTRTTSSFEVIDVL